MAIRTDAHLQAIEDAGQQKRLRFQGSEDLLADLVIMATGIRTNLDWLEGSGITINRGVLVDDQLRSSVPNVYAAGDVAEGKDLITGEPAVHAIEPTAMEHGRIAGANMAGQPLAYRGSLLMNIVDVLGWRSPVLAPGRVRPPKCPVPPNPSGRRIANSCGRGIASLAP